MTSQSESFNKLSTWQLWRQDDNGVRMLVAEYEDQDLALKALAEFESHRHKQTYWIVESSKAGGPTPQQK